MTSFDRYHNAVWFLEGLSTLSSHNYMTSHAHPEIYIQRMRYLLKLLGNPHIGPKYIHITGTAGKGSVANMIYQVLVEEMVSHDKKVSLRGVATTKQSHDQCIKDKIATSSCTNRQRAIGAGLLAMTDDRGKNIGLFTSPFPTTTIEKFSVNGKYISPDEFADLVDEIKPVLDIMAQKCPYGVASYFEVCTALALLYFNALKCAWGVMEVGCGGRYDSTNVIPAPVATVITNIGLDHTRILGNTLSKIAYEKAGIIKKGSRVYTAEHRSRLRKIFEDECKKVGAVMIRYCRDGVNPVSTTNKSLVRAVMTDMGISHDCIERGIAQARLPCRFEIIQKHPTVILDGAHNDVKLFSTIENLESVRYKKLWLILALGTSKKVEKSLSVLCKKADHVICTQFKPNGHNQAIPPHELEQKVRKWNTSVTAFLDPSDALDYALANAGNDDTVLITGSFFLAGGLRTRWVSEEHILTHRTSFFV